MFQADKKRIQEKIVDAAKKAIKYFYLSKKITKDDYKMIMKKVVTKVCMLDTLLNFKIVFNIIKSNKFKFRNININF